MGRKMWLLVGLMVLVFGSICCAGKEENQKNSFREREQSVGFAESFSLPAYAESPYENAIYFLPTTARDQNILYWDLEQNAAVPLCGKAECAHDTKECNAWTGNPRMDVVQVIEDKLYVMDHGDYSHASSATGIYRMDLDGSNREELCQIHVPGGSPQNGIIYKEYFYCRGIAGTTSQGFSKAAPQDASQIPSTQIKPAPSSFS